MQLHYISRCGNIGSGNKGANGPDMDPDFTGPLINGPGLLIKGPVKSGSGKICVNMISL